MAAISTLVDSFNSLDSAKWSTVNVGGITFASGLVTIPAATHYPELSSLVAYDLTNSSCVLKISSMPNHDATDNSVAGGLSLFASAATDDVLEITGDATSLVARERVGGVSSETTFAYNATNHKWWRIRSTGTTVFWETSPDGTTWTVQKTKTTTIPLTSLKVKVFAGNWVGVATPGNFVADELNPTATSFSRSASLSGSGTLTATAKPGYARTASFGGVGYLSANPLFKRTSFGAFVDEAVHGGQFPYAVGAYSSFETAMGAKLKRMSVFCGFSETLPTDAAFKAYATSGHEVMLAWDVAYAGGKVSFADIRAGVHDSILASVFDSCEAYGGPVVIRPWWEFNDSNSGSAPGNGSCATTAEWIATWRYVVNYYRSHYSSGRVKFFWCANGSDIGPNAMESFWPGAAYVDEVGFDTYNETEYSSWQTFEQKVGPIYDRVVATAAVDGAPGNALPVSIGEIGSVSGTAPGQARADFFQGMYLTGKFPRLKHVTFFHTANTGTDWRINVEGAGPVNTQYLAQSPDNAPSVSVSLSGSGTLSKSVVAGASVVRGFTGSGTLTVSALAVGASVTAPVSGATGTARVPAVQAGGAANVSAPVSRATSLAPVPTVSGAAQAVALVATGTTQALAPTASATAGAVVQAVRVGASGFSPVPVVAVPASVGAVKTTSTGSAGVPTVLSLVLVGVPVASGGASASGAVFSAQAFLPVPPVGVLGAARGPALAVQSAPTGRASVRLRPLNLQVGLHRTPVEVTLRGD